MIWKNFLEGAFSYTQGLRLSEENLRELANIPLNGREVSTRPPLQLSTDLQLLTMPRSGTLVRAFLHW